MLLYFSKLNSVTKILSIFIVPKNNLLFAKPSKIILGIDPGTLVMGYGIIEVTP